MVGLAAIIIPCCLDMLLVSFGSPSTISYAVTNIVRHAMNACVGAHAVFQVVHLEDFKEKWNAYSPEERRAVLVVSDCPHADIIELLSATREPIMVSCDSVDHIVRYLIRTHKMEFAPAVRFATQVVCSLEVLAQAPNVLCITPERYDEDLTSFAASLISFAGMPCTDAMFDQIKASLAVGCESESETFRHFALRHFPQFADASGGLALSESEEATLRDVGGHYGALIESRPLTQVKWPIRLFLDGDRPGSFLARELELLGPARCIVYGPYLHLPVGRWRMSVDVETRECLSDNRLRAEVVCARILSAVTLDLPEAMAFGFDLDFEIENPLLAVELRVHLLTGAIEGSLRLLDVRLSRRAEA